jgi:DNA-binding MarR family transcriptional regulator
VADGSDAPVRDASRQPARHWRYLSAYAFLGGRRWWGLPKRGLSPASLLRRPLGGGARPPPASTASCPTGATSRVDAPRWTGRPDGSTEERTNQEHSGVPDIFPGPPEGGAREPARIKTRPSKPNGGIMHRYKLEFTSTAIDQKRIRDLLAHEFRASEISLDPLPTASRKPRQPRAQLRAQLEARALACLSDGKPWRRKALLEKVCPISNGSLDLALVRLEGCGAIRKVRHGVFLSADAPEPDERDIPDWPSFRSPSGEKALALLAEPRSAPRLQEILGVTRQRVDQILRRLIAGGLARRFRVVGERGLFVYVRADSDPSDILPRRTPELTESRAQILSALPPETLCRASDVGAVTQLHQFSFYYLNQLGAMGLLVNVKLGPRRYAAITPKGLQHPQYDGSAPKVAAADIINDFGETRAKFIQMLHVLGSAQTIDLTYALPKAYFGGKSWTSGFVIQRLERLDLIEVSTTDQRSKRPSYRLTEKGRHVAGILSRLREPIPADDLRAIIAARRREYTEGLRSRRMGQSSGGTVSVP